MNDVAPDIETSDLIMTYTSDGGVSWNNGTTVNNDGSISFDNETSVYSDGVWSMSDVNYTDNADFQNNYTGIWYLPGETTYENGTILYANRTSMDSDDSFHFLDNGTDYWVNGSVTVNGTEYADEDTFVSTYDGDWITEGNYTYANGTSFYANGTIVDNTEMTVKFPNGTEIDSDGTFVYLNGSMWYTNGSVYDDGILFDTENDFIMKNYTDDDGNEWREG